MGRCGSKVLKKDMVALRNNEVKATDGQSRGSSTNSTSSTDQCNDEPMRRKSSPGNGIRRTSLFMENRGTLTELFEMSKGKLGEGSYGSVAKGRDKSTGAIRAIKSINKSQKQSSMDRITREIQIMQMMDHPNIIKLYETLEDSKCIYLVMELCTGGELFERIIEAGHFTEAQAATIIQQIVRAINYMHEASVCHRDLKPENFLFQNMDPIDKSVLKLIDFGLSLQFTPDHVMTTKLGTPFYVAPQVLKGKYNHTSDLWSVGVIMYVLLCGYPPFYGETDKEVLHKVKSGSFSFPVADWGNVSDDAKQLISKLLTMEPKLRYTAGQALNHVWIKEKAPHAKLAFAPQFLDNMRHFRHLNTFKRAVLHTIALHLNDEKIVALREAFVSMDGNGDGSLTVAEIKVGIQDSLQKVPVDLQQILDSIDTDGSGVIDYTEFLAATLDRRYFVEEDVCWAAFRIFDKNGDGKISIDELKEVLGDGSAVESVVGKETCETLIAQVDRNGDGAIDFDEFMVMMRADISPSHSKYFSEPRTPAYPPATPTSPAFTFAKPPSPTLSPRFLELSLHSSPSRRPLATFRPTWVVGPQPALVEMTLDD